MNRYNPPEIEQKWQKSWQTSNIYQAIDLDSSRQKKYILVEFPYPSGAALHVGHAFRYTVPDVYARYLRMSGYNVLFPIGYDAFGLPTEERARKDGKNPIETTRENIEAFRVQLHQLGYSFDWSRELSTTDPKYYKWTQWIFAELYKSGYVEQRAVELWWCDAMSTVLANEEVLDDPTIPGAKISERGEHPVVKKVMTQWVIKITEFAEKLLEGLEIVDWPEYIKDMQRNWIGKSTGYQLTWELCDKRGNLSGKVCSVFTTRLDTLPGVTFLVVAPEQDAVGDFVSKEQEAHAKAYIDSVASKSERERSIGKDKTGVFAGNYAINPLTGEIVPVYLADYVLAGYGTGVVMGMGGHDERDREFAIAHNLSYPLTTEPPKDWDTNLIYSGEGVQINSGSYDGKSRDQVTREVFDVLSASGKAVAKTNYKLRDWVFSRQRYWGEPFPFEYKKILGPHSEDEEVISIEGEDYKIEVLPLDRLPLLLPPVEDYLPAADGQSPLAKTDWINIRNTGGEVIGKHESDTMPNWAGSCWYYLRYLDVNNDSEFAAQDKLDYWLPVDVYFGGSEHTTLHLLYSRMWHAFLYERGLVPTPEPYQRRLNGGMLLGSDGTKMSKSLGNVLSPSDKIAQYGADALRMYINFIGPYEATVIWQEGGLKACKTVLDRVWEMRHKANNEVIETSTIEQLRNLTTKSITENLNNLKTNVCIAKLMSFTTALKDEPGIASITWITLLKLLAPFAPHLSEELYHQYGQSGSIHISAWPTWSETKLISDTTTMVVQVNGKIRAEIVVKTGTSESEIIDSAKQAVQKWLEGSTVKFVKVIPGKMVAIAI